MGDSDQYSAEYVQRFFRPVLRFFLARGFPREDAEDLAQETFLRALKTWTPGHDSPDSWIFTIARRAYLDELRRKHAQKRSGEGFSLEDLPAAENVASSEKEPIESLITSESTSNRWRRLEKELEDLPPKMRRCMFLRLDGYSYGEIAAVLGLSAETVRSHLSQGKSRLQQRLSGEFRFDDFGAQP